MPNVSIKYKHTIKQKPLTFPNAVWPDLAGQNPSGVIKTHVFETVNQQAFSFPPASYQGGKNLLTNRLGLYFMKTFISYRIAFCYYYNYQDYCWYYEYIPHLLCLKMLWEHVTIRDTHTHTHTHKKCTRAERGMGEFVIN